MSDFIDMRKPPTPARARAFRRRYVAEKLVKELLEFRDRTGEDVELLLVDYRHGYGCEFMIKVKPIAVTL